MDSNGQRFWMWSRPGDWRGLDGCVMAPPPHDAATPRLALAPERPAPPVRPGVERALAAETELARLPVLRDRLGTHARWDVSTNTLMGYGAFDGEVLHELIADLQMPGARRIGESFETWKKVVLVVELADRQTVVRRAVLCVRSGGRGHDDEREQCNHWIFHASHSTTKWLFSKMAMP